MTTDVAARVSRRSLGTGTGMLITPAQDGVTLLDTAQHLVKDLQAAGHVLLRGFTPSVDDFNALVSTCSSTVTLDPARQFHGNVAQLVDSGTGAIGLHLENGATPYPPDLLWFHCVKAAASGSQTTVCDGRRVWEGLSTSVRNLFQEKPIVFARSVGEEQWRQFTAFSLADGQSPDEVGIEDLRKLAASGNTRIEPLSDGSVYYEFETWAAHSSKWSRQLTWANSIFGPSFNYETPRIRFGDGTNIPPEVLDELARVTEDMTEEIAWQDGDVVLIDNSRVMHGRRAITDTDRTVVNAQSFAA